MLSPLPQPTLTANTHAPLDDALTLGQRVLCLPYVAAMDGDTGLIPVTVNIRAGKTAFQLVSVILLLLVIAIAALAGRQSGGSVTLAVEGLAVIPSLLRKITGAPGKL